MKTPIFQDWIETQFTILVCDRFLKQDFEFVKGKEKKRTRKRAKQAAHELIARIQSERKKEKEVHDKRVSAETGQGDV